ncbi:Phosphatase YidA [Sebaldella termitidis]|jgi:Cof subfamily protein (haloacid dehalogenase superfamily)|uniref:Cof-like hydrolase n=1 Tax=Sebaldella termitidis (strain ATCC 33386 / NCTC 11300) TaxID=526218 RepID=D1ANU9_SEBTE|nr:Cof-type HAD-IIB family hydrolase [Sebaldella termitidis]ACZ07423.1 Cof-like hydrolase [Sebaldella termitidis ATCC 33386]SUI22718.1 Phosphatase YidA [Sebaldella termitidis]
MGIKAIVMDVDGTLTNDKKEITPKTREVLLKAQEQGILLILASGRPTTGLVEMGKVLEMDKNNGLFISYNGSKVINFQTGEELFNEPLKLEDAKAVLEHMKKFEIKPMIDKGDYMYVNDVYNCMIRFRGEPFNVIKYESRGGNYKLCEIDDLAAFVDYPLNKILTAGEPEYLQEHYIEMMEPFKDKLNCMFTGPFYFEFTAKDIDKAKALDTVLKPLDITADEVIAFGDGHNDISIIKYAGTGVAMENAVADLKEAADEITLSNEQDGIAESLLKHISNL